MKLTMLGTGNASVTNCYNTCFALSEGDKHFLVDAGGGNQILSQLETADIPLGDIHDIFVTHEHIDHILGVIWLIRMIGQRMARGSYQGVLRIYCFPELAEKIRMIVNMTIQKKVCVLMGERIQFVEISHGDTQIINGNAVTFFDIHSTKAKQFGFTMAFSDGVKFTCLGDEPYHEADYEYVKGSDWLMHEAFCLYSEADRFKPYEKHHSTVKEACQFAKKLQVPNLILYHTEDKNILNRKKLYAEEGKAYYTGTLYVPDDLEEILIC